MRTGLVSLVGLIGVLALAAHDGAETVLPKRYGLELDSKTYPQSTPKEALASLLKAVDSRRVDYVLAQLADPDWVDRRVKESRGGFPALVEESTARLLDNHATVKQLKRLLAAGEWKMGSATATVRSQDSEEGALFLRKSGGRWYVENRKK